MVLEVVGVLSICVEDVKEEEGPFVHFRDAFDLRPQLLNDVLGDGQPQTSGYKLVKRGILWLLLIWSLRDSFWLCWKRLKMCGIFSGLIPIPESMTMNLM